MTAGLRRPVDVVTVQPAPLGCLQVQPIDLIGLHSDVESEVGRKEIPIFGETADAAVDPLRERLFSQGSRTDRSATRRW